MSDQRNPAYSVLDRPDILQFLFHPRPEYPHASNATPGTPVMIPVSAEISIGACFHVGEKSFPNILFFHGNGEIVADYDELGPLYNQMGINFFPVDYRGYGRSGGRPTVSAMMTDCHTIFDYTKQWLEENGHTGPLVIMGRSLGSASALELAVSKTAHISGLIVESGFAYLGPLLKLLGVRAGGSDFEKKISLRQIDKIKSFMKPTLIIHAEYDHIIPFSEGKALFDACGSKDKTFLKIPKANHNDIFARSLYQYIEAVRTLCQRAGS